MKKWECTVCGYIHAGDEPPDHCPVCGADKSLFIEIVEEHSNKPVMEKPEVIQADKWRCTVCQYPHNGASPPESCPVCGSDATKFEPDTSDAGTTEPVTDTTPIPAAKPEKRDLGKSAPEMADKPSGSSVPKKKAHVSAVPETLSGLIYKGCVIDLM